MTQSLSKIDEAQLHDQSFVLIYSHRLQEAMVLALCVCNAWSIACSMVLLGSKNPFGREGRRRSSSSILRAVSCSRLFVHLLAVWCAGTVLGVSALASAEREEQRRAAQRSAAPADSTGRDRSDCCGHCSENGKCTALTVLRWSGWRSAQRCTATHLTSLLHSDWPFVSLSVCLCLRR